MPSDEMLRGLLAAAPDALLAVDIDGNIVFVSDQVEQLFGWSRSELIGQEIEILVPDRFHANHPSLRNSYFKHPVSRPMGAGLELWARRKDGTEFPAEISLSGFTTRERSLVAAAIRDATVARRTEQRFRAVLASAPDATVGVDESGRIVLANAQAERLFGWTADELMGRQVEMLVPEGIAERHVKHRATFAAEPSARPMGAGMQLSGLCKGGRTFPAEISLSTVNEADGALLVLAAVRDITERLEIEGQRRQLAVSEQQAQSQRLEALGQLAGGIAHDFNNLLGVILNYTTLLSRQLIEPQPAADLAEIRSAAERAAALTRQLLAFARREVVNPEPLDINEVVTAFSSLLARTLGEHISLAIEVADEPLVVSADPHQLEQILLNLAVNSRDAMPMGGSLRIVTRPINDDGESETNKAVEGSLYTHVLLAITDDGLGMDPEVLNRAFEPFFTTKPVGEGTGLGLATVFGIVGQNNGRVTIESSPGNGTTVSVVLPHVDATPVNFAAVAEPVTGGRERILLVEDEARLRVATERILADHGYEVFTAIDGVDALEIFERLNHEVDLVLTDVAMPRMRGDEMAGVLKHRKPSIRVLFMSGYDSGHAGLDGQLLEKPVAEHLMLRVIREMLHE